jgi:hypothetical protein
MGRETSKELQQFNTVELPFGVVDAGAPGAFFIGERSESTNPDDTSIERVGGEGCSSPQGLGRTDETKAVMRWTTPQK